MLWHVNTFIGHFKQLKFLYVNEGPFFKLLPEKGAEAYVPYGCQLSINKIGDTSLMGGGLGKVLHFLHTHFRANRPLGGATIGVYTVYQ